MLDFIMRLSMPLWILVSALFPVYLASMVIKAVIHARRMRRPFLKAAPRRPTPPWMDTQDWVPSP